VVGTKLGHAFKFPAPTHSGHGDAGMQPHLTLADAIGDLPLLSPAKMPKRMRPSRSNESLSLVE